MLIFSNKNFILIYTSLKNKAIKERGKSVKNKTKGQIYLNYKN